MVDDEIPKTAQQLQKIVNELKKGPKTWTELKVNTAISEKSLHRYLVNYLAIIGLTDKNENDEWVFLPWFRNLSKDDYEAALVHSNKLFNIEMTDGRKLLEVHPYRRIDLILFKKDAIENHHYLQSIYNHLITGYGQNIRNSIHEYKTTIEAIGLNKLPQPPYLSDCSNLPAENEITIEKIVGVEYVGNNASKYLTETYGLPATVKKTSITRLIYLRDIILNQLTAITYRLKNGTPLEGICDLCPKKYIEIVE